MKIWTAVLAAALIAPASSAVMLESTAHAEPARGLKSSIALRAANMIRAAASLRTLASRPMPRSLSAAEAKQWESQSQSFVSMAKRLDALAQQVRAALEEKASDTVLNSLSARMAGLQKDLEKETSLVDLVNKVLRERQDQAKDTIRHLKN